ncbi:hypothetical protein [Paracidovorax citrulli]
MPYTITSFSQYYEALKTNPESLINGILKGEPEAKFNVQGRRYRLVTDTRGGIQHWRVVRRHPKPGSAHGTGESWTQKLMFLIADNLFLRCGVRRMGRALRSRETAAAGFQTRFLAETIDKEFQKLFPKLGLVCNPHAPCIEPDKDAGFGSFGNAIPTEPPRFPAVAGHCLPNLVVSAAHDLDSWANYPDPRGPISAKTIDRTQSRIVGAQLVLVFREPDTDRQFEFHLALPGDVDMMARAVRDRQRLLDVALGTKGSGSYRNMAELLAEFVVQTVEEEMPVLLAKAARKAVQADEKSEHFAFLPLCKTAGSESASSSAQRRLLKEFEPAIRIAVDNAMRECRAVVHHFAASTAGAAASASLSEAMRPALSEFQSIVGRIELEMSSRPSASGAGMGTLAAIDQLAYERPQQDIASAHRFCFRRKRGLFSRLLGRKPVVAEIVTTRLESLSAPVLAPVPPLYRQAADFGLQRYVGKVHASSVDQVVQQLCDTEFDQALVSLFNNRLFGILESNPPRQHVEPVRGLLGAVRIGKTTFGALRERREALGKTAPSVPEGDTPVTWSIRTSAMSPREAGGAALMANLLGEDWSIPPAPVERYGLSKRSGKVFLQRYEEDGIPPATGPQDPKATEPVPDQRPEPKPEPELLHKSKQKLEQERELELQQELEPQPEPQLAAEPEPDTAPDTAPEYVPEEDDPFAAGSGTVQVFPSSSASASADADSDSEVQLY